MVFGGVRGLAKIKMNKRVNILVSGRVQGVFFRACTREKAQELNLLGYVKNLPDGSVTIVAEGNVDAIEALISWSRHGPSDATVSRVEVTEEEFLNEFADFAVRF